MELALLVLGLILGGAITYYVSGKGSKNVITQDTSVLLEKINTVSKLVTVEGHYNEVVHYNQSSKKWLSLIPQNKKAVVIIKAKALVGFDLSKAQFEIDADQKRIYLHGLPEPELISIDPEIEYYDIKQSALNKFSPEDHSNLQKNALDVIRNKVMEGDLPRLAKVRGIDTLKVLKELTAAYGWGFQVKPEDLDKLPNTNAKQLK